METLFISDLHLSAQRPDLIEGFGHWLKAQHGRCHALYILGDFFDAWIGDDDDAPEVQQISSWLRELSQSTPLFFIRGNRDFLVGEAFCQQAGMTLLSDAHTIDLYGRPALLMHGDTLCTEDKEYQQFRKMVRDPGWQQQVLALPLPQRRAMAADLRNKSQSMNAMKAEDIMDVTPSEVEKAMTEHGVQTLIHGHTHRPAVHDLVINDQPAQRWVLGDWHTSGWCAHANEQGIALKQFPIPEK